MNLDTNLCANVVVVAGIGFGIAKVMTGLLVDTFDSRYMTYFFMLATAVTVFGFSFTESYEAMLILGFLNAIPQAGGYPALNKIVYDTLPPEQYGQVHTHPSLLMAKNREPFYGKNPNPLNSCLRLSPRSRLVPALAPVVLISYLAPA